MYFYSLSYRCVQLCVLPSDIFCCDLQVFPRENVVSALVTVYKYNVLQFQDGTMGAVNGMRPNGQVSGSLLPVDTILF